MKTICRWWILFVLPLFYFGCGEDSSNEVSRLNQENLSLQKEISSLKSEIMFLGNTLKEKESDLAACEKGEGQQLTCPITLVQGIITVRSDSYWDYPFWVFDGQKTRLKGKFEVTAGKDIEVYVFDDLNFKNWKANAVAKPLFRSGRVAVGEIDLPVAQVGLYHIIFNNRFSVITTKDVYASIEQLFD